MAKSSKNDAAVEFVVPADALQRERELSHGLSFHGEKVPLSRIRADFSRNVRIRPGSVVLPGLEWKADTYDTESMIMAIVQIGYIKEPITVSKKTDPKTGEVYYEVLRGFRRYDAATRIVAAGTNLNVIRSFEEIPCHVYENLTKDQEDNLINDQTSKQFAGCEVLREVWRRLGNGQSWQTIGLDLCEQIARVTGSRGKDADIRKASTQTEKLAIVQKWLNTTLNMFWQGVYSMGGQQTKKWLFLTLAEKDGLLKEGDEHAPFPLTATVWRGAAGKENGLYHAIKADMSAGVWDREKGSGPAFEARVEELKQEEADRKSGTRKSKSGEHTPKSGQTIYNMSIKDGRAVPIRQALESCLEGFPAHQLEQWDERLNLWLAKSQSFNDNRGALPDGVRELLSLAFDPTASGQDFDARLAALIAGSVGTVNPPVPAEEVATVPTGGPDEFPLTGGEEMATAGGGSEPEGNPSPARGKPHGKRKGR
jgi:hypothetical protein